MCSIEADHESMLSDECKTKAGPELDWAVVEALELKTTAPVAKEILITSRDWDETRGIPHCTTEGPFDLIACKPFSPSTDLNAAFAAAEKAGLFDIKGLEAVLHQYREAKHQHRTAKTTWVVAFKDTITLHGCQAVYGATPALAICAAILKLKELKGDEA